MLVDAAKDDNRTMLIQEEEEYTAFKNNKGRSTGLGPNQVARAADDRTSQVSKQNNVQELFSIEVQDKLKWKKSKTHVILFQVRCQATNLLKRIVASRKKHRTIDNCFFSSNRKIVGCAIHTATAQ